MGWELAWVLGGCILANPISVLYVWGEVEEDE